MDAVWLLRTPVSATSIWQPKRQREAHHWINLHSGLWWHSARLVSSKVLGHGYLATWSHTLLEGTSPSAPKLLHLFCFLQKLPVYIPRWESSDKSPDIDLRGRDECALAGTGRTGAEEVLQWAAAADGNGHILMAAPSRAVSWSPPRPAGSTAIGNKHLESVFRRWVWNTTAFWHGRERSVSRGTCEDCESVCSCGAASMWQVSSLKITQGDGFVV